MPIHENGLLLGIAGRASRFQFHCWRSELECELGRDETSPLVQGRESRAHQDSIRAPGTESWTWYPSRTANEAAVTAASKAASLVWYLPIGSPSCLTRQIPPEPTTS